jgi:hypothetical protein
MATKTKHTAARNKSARSKQQPRKWSGKVTQESDALDLESSVFKSGSATHIAASLKHSAEKSKRRKTTPFQSAMSMLNFYINRAGSNLSVTRKRTLERAKDKLREAFGKTPAKKKPATKKSK